MRVLVAGATGALGAPTVRRLVARGHEVTGLTRSASKRGMLESLGAVPLVADVMDPASLRPVVAEAAPEGVIHALTALPRNGPTRARHLVATNLLRDRGTGNLLDAATAAGATRMVAESIVLVYGFGGPETITEKTPVLESSPAPSFQPALDALLSLERQVMRSDRIEGIALRYGLFYGPGNGSTEYAVRMARRRMLPIPGDGAEVTPWIHLEDAAEATVLALERGRPGEAYNVVDDEPVTTEAFITELARAARTPKPPHVPWWVIRLVAPFLTSGRGARLNVSNEKARRELGWTLQYPTYREGLRTLAS